MNAVELSTITTAELRRLQDIETDWQIKMHNIEALRRERIENRNEIERLTRMIAASNEGQA